MANHGFVRLRHSITGAQFKAAMDKINQDRFGGILRLEYDKAGWDECPTVHIYVAAVHSPQWEATRTFWLRYPNKIEHRHGPGGMVVWWIEHVFANDLAVALNGVLSDQGSRGERWLGEANRYPTFKTYLQGSTKKSLLERAFLWYFHRMEYKEALRLNPKFKPYLG